MKIYVVMLEDHGDAGIIIAVSSKEKAREIAKREFRKWHYKDFHYCVKEAWLL